QRVVPAKALLLELTQRLGRRLSRLKEIAIFVGQVICQKGEQVILQQATDERDIRIGSQEQGDFTGEHGLLKVIAPERSLVDQLRAAGAHGSLDAGRDHEQSAAGAAQKGRSEEHT